VPKPPRPPRRRHEDAFRRREEALRKKDVELQDSLIKFNKSVLP
jgi:hypothetical protein